MIYIVGLIVFSAIGSFVIGDSIALWKDLQRQSLKRCLPEFFRLLMIAGMAAIGYFAASATFQSLQDAIIFLGIGIVGAFGVYLGNFMGIRSQ